MLNSEFVSSVLSLNVQRSPPEGSKTPQKFSKSISALNVSTLKDLAGILDSVIRKIVFKIWSVFCKFTWSRGFLLDIMLAFLHRRYFIENPHGGNGILSGSGRREDEWKEIVRGFDAKRAMRQERLISRKAPSALAAFFPIHGCLAIMHLQDFLVEHAMFPFPQPDHDEYRTAGTTNVSQFEVAMLEREWKAGHAVRDDTLVQKLCQALEDILEDTPLEAGAENYLLEKFSHQLKVDERGTENEAWDMNPSETQVSI